MTCAEADPAFVIIYARRGERFILTWRPSTQSEALRTLSRWACDPDLPFTWHDAAQCAAAIYHLEAQQICDPGIDPRAGSGA